MQVSCSYICVYIFRYPFFFSPSAPGSHLEDLINARFHFLMLFHFLDGGPAMRRPDLKL